MSSSSSVEGTRLRRKSAFKEVGLADDDKAEARQRSTRRPALKVRFRSKNDVFEPPIPNVDGDDWEDTSASSSDDDAVYKVRYSAPRPRQRPSSDKFALVAFVIII